MPQKLNFESKKIRILGENGINSKLKYKKAHNSILSGRFGDLYGRLLSYLGDSWIIWESWMYEWIEHPPGVREVTGSNPVGDSDFFFIPCS